LATPVCVSQLNKYICSSPSIKAVEQNFVFLRAHLIFFGENQRKIICLGFAFRWFIVGAEAGLVVVCLFARLIVLF
jgi:hypothetical protein